MERNTKLNTELNTTLAGLLFNDTLKAVSNGGWGQHR